MTCKDIGAFCLSRRNKEKQDAILNATILFRISEKIIVGVSAKPKSLSFKDLFSDLLNENNEVITEEHKQKMIVQKWLDFLKN